MHFICVLCDFYGLYFYGIVSSGSALTPISPMVINSYPEVAVMPSVSQSGRSRIGRRSAKRPRPVPEIEDMAAEAREVRGFTSVNRIHFSATRNLIKRGSWIGQRHSARPYLKAHTYVFCV